MVHSNGGRPRLKIGRCRLMSSRSRGASRRPKHRLTTRGRGYRTPGAARPITANHSFPAYQFTDWRGALTVPFPAFLGRSASAVTQALTATPGAACADARHEPGNPTDRSARYAAQRACASASGPRCSPAAGRLDSGPDDSARLSMSSPRPIRVGPDPRSGSGLCRRVPIADRQVFKTSFHSTSL